MPEVLEVARVGTFRAGHIGMGVRTFQELIAWQRSAELRDEIVAICATAPAQQDRDFRDQFSSAAAAAPALIAEGFGRYARREFRRYLQMARGELVETQNHLDDARRRGWIDQTAFDRLWRLSIRAIVATTRLRSSIPERGSNR